MTTSSVVTTYTNSNEIISDKENNPLPVIDYAKLANPQDVVEKNYRYKLLTKAKLPKLAV